MHGTKDDKYWLDKELQQKAIRLLYSHWRIVTTIEAQKTGNESHDTLVWRTIEGCHAGVIDELGRAIESSYWKINKETAATASNLRQMIDSILFCLTDKEKLAQIEVVKGQLEVLKKRFREKVRASAGTVFICLKVLSITNCLVLPDILFGVSWK
jgi:hypothetical protein